MNLNYILENKDLRTLLNNSIGKTYNRYKLNFIIEKEDFIQETYIFIMKRIDSFDSEKSSLKTYIPLLVMTSARHCIQKVNGQSENYNKLDIKNNTLSLDFEFDNNKDSEVSFQECLGEDKENEVEAKLILDEILELKCLTKIQKQVLELLRQDKNLREISKILGITPSYTTKIFKKCQEKIVKNYAV